MENIYALQQKLRESFLTAGCFTTNTRLTLTDVMEDAILIGKVNMVLGFEHDDERLKDVYLYDDTPYISVDAGQGYTLYSKPYYHAPANLITTEDIYKFLRDNFNKGVPFVKKNTLELLKRVKNDDDLTRLGFDCMGTVVNYFPSLPEEVLDNNYGTWVCANNDGYRVVMLDQSNGHWSYVCEGTEEAIIEHYRLYHANEHIIKALEFRKEAVGNELQVVDYSLINDRDMPIEVRELRFIQVNALRYEMDMLIVRINELRAEQQANDVDMDFDIVGGAPTTATVNGTDINFHDLDEISGSVLAALGFKLADDINYANEINKAIAGFNEWSGGMGIVLDFNGYLHLFHRLGNDYFTYWMPFDKWEPEKGEAAQPIEVCHQPYPGHEEEQKAIAKAIEFHENFIKKLKEEYADVDITVTVQRDYGTPFEQDEYLDTYVVKGKELDQIEEVNEYSFVEDILYGEEADGSITTTYCFEHHPSVSTNKTINYRVGNFPAESVHKHFPEVNLDQLREEYLREGSVSFDVTEVSFTELFEDAVEIGSVKDVLGYETENYHLYSVLLHNGQVITSTEAGGSHLDFAPSDFITKEMVSTYLKSNNENPLIKKRDELVTTLQVIENSSMNYQLSPEDYAKRESELKKMNESLQRIENILEQFGVTEDDSDGLAQLPI